MPFMKHVYRLSIHLESADQSTRIGNILGVQPSKAGGNIWELEVEETKDAAPIDFVDYFLSILGERFPELESIGIKRSHISMWLLYEYDGQCNLEFTPNQLKKLGERGICLCVSCWAA